MTHHIKRRYHLETRGQRTETSQNSHNFQQINSKYLLLKTISDHSEVIEDLNWNYNIKKLISFNIFVKTSLFYEAIKAFSIRIGILVAYLNSVIVIQSTDNLFNKYINDYYSYRQGMKNHIFSIASLFFCLVHQRSPKFIDTTWIAPPTPRRSIWSISLFEITATPPFILD